MNKESVLKEIKSFISNNEQQIKHSAKVIKKNAVGNVAVIENSKESEYIPYNADYRIILQHSLIASVANLMNGHMKNLLRKLANTETQESFDNLFNETLNDYTETLIDFLLEDQVFGDFIDLPRNELIHIESLAKIVRYLNLIKRLDKNYE